MYLTQMIATCRNGSCTVPNLRTRGSGQPCSEVRPKKRRKKSIADEVPQALFSRCHFNVRITRTSEDTCFGRCCADHARRSCAVEGERGKPVQTQPSLTQGEEGDWCEAVRQRLAQKQNAPSITESPLSAGPSLAVTARDTVRRRKKITNRASATTVTGSTSWTEGKEQGGEYREIKKGSLHETFA